jgi:hypothetical protein
MVEREAPIERPKGEVAESGLDARINGIITSRQFSITQSEKEELLLPIFKEEMSAAFGNNVHVRSYYTKLGLEIGGIKSLREIPPIPVQMFKLFDLTTCKKSEVVRVLKSSSTTSQLPSRVPMDKTTAFRQIRALNSTLSSFLGSKRRPLLVLDCPDINKAEVVELTARGAAVRGLSAFASEICYAMKIEGGRLVLDGATLDDFSRRNAGKEIFAFGFTFIIWSEFLKELENREQLSFKDALVIHSGGWKKLVNLKVSKEEFGRATARAFGTSEGNVLDFYGMVEQTGVVFVDCEFGNKHVPDFAEVIIRDPYSMKEVPLGETGIIEVLSILPRSYAGQAILTEDTGKIIGIENCPCSRKGKYFRFEARIEKAEIRGCGDTFAESRKGSNG